MFYTCCWRCAGPPSPAPAPRGCLPRRARRFSLYAVSLFCSHCPRTTQLLLRAVWWSPVLFASLSAASVVCSCAHWPCAASGLAPRVARPRRETGASCTPHTRFEVVSRVLLRRTPTHERSSGVSSWATAPRQRWTRFLTHLITRDGTLPGVPTLQPPSHRASAEGRST